MAGKVKTTREARHKRHERVRMKVKGTAARPRLSVARSLNNIYAQVIDDLRGHTLACASTLDAEIKESLAGKNKTDTARLVGALIARRTQETGIKEVVFDRGGNLYHGRVKALAEGAREGGLKF
ncbi:MAG: 50S ribosomal protein L18 [Chloroflexota bacterium]